MLRHPILALLHEGTNGRRRRVKLGDAMFGANLPKTAVVGVRWQALEHDACCTVQQGTVDEVAVTWK